MEESYSEMKCFIQTLELNSTRLLGSRLSATAITIIIITIMKMTKILPFLQLYLLYYNYGVCVQFSSFQFSSCCFLISLLLLLFTWYIYRLYGVYLLLLLLFFIYIFFSVNFKVPFKLVFLVWWWSRSCKVPSL